MSSKYAPIVLFAYKRADHLRQTVEHLRANELASESELIIVSDGYRNDSDKEGVLAVREYIKTIDGFRKVRIVERKRNYGLGSNIISALTAVFKRYDRAIIVEDDIITGKYFLRYMNASLDKYNGNENVAAISGYIPNIDRTGVGDYFFLPWFECWGWATWSSRWKRYRKAPKEIICDTGLGIIHRLNINGTSPDMWNQVLDNFRGKIKTWAIFFCYMVLKENGLVLFPRESLCRNTGFDGTGENCDSSKDYEVSVAESAFREELLPDKCEADSLAVKRYVDFNRERFKPLVKRRIVLTVKTLLYYFLYHIPSYIKGGGRP